MKFEEIFPHIFVINLDEHQERWKRAQAELIKAGVTHYHRFPAVKVKGGQTLANRIYGCKKSHLELIRLARAGEMEHILIFEDDLEVDDAFQAHCSIIYDFLNQYDWELFYLGGNHLLRKNYKVLGPHYLQVRSTFTTHAYAVHHSAYELLIHQLENSDYSMPVDAIYANRIQKRGKSYAIRPNLVYQRAGMSYIRQGFRNYANLKRKV